ncbi:MAG: hypothetical protein K8I00_01710, partial [Candidatus Omnitrophica bacterium]|nr:hypothetical protein [Candidatus Omnitrophota bacterium]
MAFPRRHPRILTNILALIFVTIGPAACGNGGWIQAETEHLILHYKSGTFAERDLAAAKREYEESYQALTQILPHIKLATKIKVYLHEELDKMGYTRAAMREVHF